MTLRGTEARIFLDGVDLSCVTANLGVEDGWRVREGNALQYRYGISSWDGYRWHRDTERIL